MPTLYEQHQRSQRKDMARVLRQAEQYMMTPALARIYIAATACGPTHYYPSNRYICHAIDRVTAGADMITLQAGQQMKAIISKRMNYWCAVEVWLDKEGGVPFSMQTLELLQEYRHRWLQVLIKEFSE